MIIDSHTHAWLRWPYEPPVPDDESRGTVEQLLFEMDQCGVDQAVIVCAQIDHNPDNNAYIAEKIRRYPTRLHQFADVDCSWSTTYHTPGAADRLAQAAEQWPLKGFTHYVRGDDDGSWFLSEEGSRFFRKAEERKLIVSMAIGPQLQPVLRQVAERFPSVPFVCHHMAGARASESPPYPRLKEILASAKQPNIFIKMSGFAYVSQVDWDYPYSDTGWIVRALYEHFGPARLCWGSDYPVVRWYMTYRHALEAFRTHCPFIPEKDKAEILGGTLYRLLTTGQVAG
jgi:predicted TIM-barrel fold metal-dependent hydrolase